MKKNVNTDLNAWVASIAPAHKPDLSNLKFDLEYWRSIYQQQCAGCNNADHAAYNSRHFYQDLLLAMDEIWNYHTAIDSPYQHLLQRMHLLCYTILKLHPHLFCDQSRPLSLYEWHLGLQHYYKEIEQHKQAIIDFFSQNEEIAMFPQVMEFKLEGKLPTAHNRDYVLAFTSDLLEWIKTARCDVLSLLKFCLQKNLNTLACVEFFVDILKAILEEIPDIWHRQQTLKYWQCQIAEASLQVSEPFCPHHPSLKKSMKEFIKVELEYYFDPCINQPNPPTNNLPAVAKFFEPTIIKMPAELFGTWLRINWEMGVFDAPSKAALLRTAVECYSYCTDKKIGYGALHANFYTITTANVKKLCMLYGDQQNFCRDIMSGKIELDKWVRPKRGEQLIPVKIPYSRKPKKPKA